MSGSEQAQRKLKAKEFVRRWQEAEGSEEREARSFWIELCQDLLGIANPTRVLNFEKKVLTKRVDVFYEDRGILIENKSRGVDLDKKEQRGTLPDGSPRMVTPYEQARWYANNLPASIKPRWVVTCNFDVIRIYDLEDEYPQNSFETILLGELPDQLHRLDFFIRKEGSRLEREKRLSVQAGQIVGKLYDALAGQYANIDNDGEEQRSLNVLVVRLVFLLYAEDAGLLQEHQAFYRYLEPVAVNRTRDALRVLFRVLDTPEDERDPYDDPAALAFPYMNGGLFHGDIVIPQFSEEARKELLKEASAGFDWSNISPTIFGAVFESTLNPETRRAGGMHYTSIENIHKVTGPLFYDALVGELEKIEALKTVRSRKARLRAFQMKLSQLRFLDPACGSGNFLTETYVSLRKLELRVIEDIMNAEGEAEGQTTLGAGLANPIMVSIDQFYGIEINDFAVSVAKTALWIAEEQMMERTQELLPFQVFDFLPLKSNSNIHEANALRMDWNDVLPAGECDYVIGNPPFLGARNQSKEQKAEVVEVFDHAKNCGNIDYVAGWYAKAANYVSDHPIRCAFVSTNSICQGEQVANIWKPLWDAGIRIDFAYDTFRWDSEAADRAHVFVVIVGFSKLGGLKTLFHHESPDAEPVCKKVANLNPYLSDAPDVFVYSRTRPLCNAPKIGIGSQPIDGGNYLFKSDEKMAFVKAEPLSEKYFHPWFGSKEFINGTPRWVLWLGDATSEDLDRMPLCRKRIEAVREYRLNSSRLQTREAAGTPEHFGTELISTTSAIIVPRHSSEHRDYVQLGFIGPEVFVGDAALLIPNATLYQFGVLESQFHNAWMRTVAGRLKSDYRYSGGIVYNNFVWPGVRGLDDLGIPVGGGGSLPTSALPSSVRPRASSMLARITRMRRLPSSMTPTRCPTTSEKRTPPTTLPWKRPTAWTLEATKSESWPICFRSTRR